MGEKIISVYWFAILFIVAAAIVYMVAVFYGAPYDVRELEANVLTNKIASCLSEGGYLIKENLDKENFLEICNLNLEVEDVYGWREQGQYYFEVDIRDFVSGELVYEIIKEGNSNLKDFCNLEGKNFPVCVERNFYSFDKEKKQYKIKILSVVRKIEKNV